MPLAGKGMLMTTMDIAPEHEAEFNEWYDREHLAERVAIDGFMEARRYVAVDAAPEYLGLYSTARFEDLSGPAYTQALANQTSWSKANMSRFRDMGRAVARITVSKGQGRGSALAMLRLRPKTGDAAALRNRIVEQFAPAGVPGVIALHLMESDPALSVSLTDPNAGRSGLGRLAHPCRWFGRRGRARLCRCPLFRRGRPGCRAHLARELSAARDLTKADL